MSDRPKNDQKVGEPTPAVVEGVDFYFNEQGLMVLTAHFLRKRGFCCKTGCTHCPYGFVKKATK